MRIQITRSRLLNSLACAVGYTVGAVSRVWGGATRQPLPKNLTINWAMADSASLAVELSRIVTLGIVAPDVKWQPAIQIRLTRVSFDRAMDGICDRLGWEWEIVGRILVFREAPLPSPLGDVAAQDLQALTEFLRQARPEITSRLAEGQFLCLEALTPLERSLLSKFTDTADIKGGNPGQQGLFGILWSPLVWMNVRGRTQTTSLLSGGVVSLQGGKWLSPNRIEEKDGVYRPLSMIEQVELMKRGL